MRNSLAALTVPWAITKPAMQALQASAHRQLVHGLTAAPGNAPSANPERRVMSVRHGVAIIPVTGVLYRADDIDFDRAGYGVSTYARIAIDVQTALDSSEVHALVLAVDSPGGQISGMQECAMQIRAAAARKPVWGHIDGEAASAAYGILCAVERITASPMAMAGSLGAIIGMYDMSEMLKQMGITEYEFISSVSPHKNPDPSTPMGREDYTALVDTLGTVLIEHIASMRAVTPADVLAQYGQGRMLIGADALSAGLVDALSTFEDTLAALAALRTDPRRLRGISPAAARALSPSMEPAMKPKTDPSAVTTDDTPGATDETPTPIATSVLVAPPVAVAPVAAIAAAVTADRARVVTLLELAGVTVSAEITTAITEGMSAETFAVAALRAVRATQTAIVGALEGHSAALTGKLAPPQRKPEAASNDAAEVDAILAHVPKEMRA